MERWTHEELHELYELMGRPTYEAFARWLHVSVRSIVRWLTNRDERPNMAMSRHIDAQVRMEVRHRHPQLKRQVEYMDRRGLLKVLAMGAAAPIGGISMAWGARPHVSAAMLDGFEDITTTLAAKYRVVEPGALLGAAMGHMEEIRGLLRDAAMQPSQRVQLEAIAADTAIFVGGLALQAGRLAHADAFFGLAERLARESDTMGLVAQALEWRCLLQWMESSGHADDDPRPRVALLTEAETLAARHAAPVVHMGISGLLAREMAAIGDAFGADKALERSWRALNRMRPEDTMKGFGSIVGSYSGYGEGTFQRNQGMVERTLVRDDAPSTLNRALELAETPGDRVVCLTQLARVCIEGDEPEDACAKLVRALPSGACTSGLVMCHVRLARVSMPPGWASLPCVRELDERLASLT